MTRGRSGVVQNTGTLAVFTSMNVRFEGNAYTISAGARPFAWRDAAHDPAGWRGFGHDLNGSYAVSS
jgi:hypothetical protein